MRRLKLIYVAGIVAIFVLVGGGLALASPGVEGPSGTPDVAKGARVFSDNCGVCHGAQGEGRLGIPNLAGAKGHLEQLGIPMEQASTGITKLLREGIPGNMPSFPPTILSDEDIANLGAYLFTLPPTTGANLYTANCALCHGSKGQGSVGPPLAGTAQRFGSLGRSKLQVLKGLPDLVRKGIAGKMPGAPQISDGEVASLGDFLWELGSWEADFKASHGRAPSAEDRADREWSLQFAQRSGRNPDGEDWMAHDAESRSYRQVTALDVGVGAPPPGGWKWVVMRRTTGANDVTEVNDNPNDHGNDWVFHVLKGVKEMGTPGGSLVLGTGEAELLPARVLHTHRFPARSEVLGFHLRPATSRPPDAFHRGEKVLYSDEALETTTRVNYRLRVRELTLAPGQRTENIEAGPSFAYVAEGALVVSGEQTATATAGQVLSLPPTQTLVVNNGGTERLKLVLVDLH